jgi:DNA-directed RNA polymerase I, II, and III subunit RPABC5
MSLPVRCFTCNKIIGNKELLYEKYLKEGYTSKDTLDMIGMNRICCRRMFLGHVNIIDQLLLFPKQLNSSYETKL